MEYLSEIASFIVGLIGGSLLTLKFTRKNTASEGSTITDQSNARADGDIVGGSKTTKP
jgi:hypothetical protein